MEVFDSSGEFLGLKSFQALVDSAQTLNQYITQFFNKDLGVAKKTPLSETTSDSPLKMAYLQTDAPDFQNNNKLALANELGKGHIIIIIITPQNLTSLGVYFSVRHCIKATWQNDRDQFYAPYDDAWQEDEVFKSDCLIFMLFHTQNRITSTQGINHFIPFSEDEVEPKERYSSHALLDFLKGGIKEGSDTLFLNAKKENKPLKFSLSASRVFDAGREIYRYYHTQDFTHTPYNANASLYDIKEFFQGRNAQGKLNLPAKAKDEYYKQLYTNLRDALKDLAKEIQPKVYEYGFLRE
ncbi:hypothetical protein ID0987_13390 [Helicobacter pylori]